MPDQGPARKRLLGLNEDFYLDWIRGVIKPAASPEPDWSCNS